MSLSGRPSSDDDSQVEDQDWSDWEDDERNAVKSLFSDKTFANIEDALQFDAQHNNFDLIRWIKEVRMQNGNHANPCMCIFHHLTRITSTPSSPCRAEPQSTTRSN